MALKRTSQDGTGKREVAASGAQRNTFTWVTTFVLLIIIVIAFVVLPISLPTASGALTGSTDFGSYDGESIAIVQSGTTNFPLSYFYQKYRDQSAYLDYLRNNQFIQWTPDQVAYSAARQAFDATVLSLALTRLAEHSGLDVAESAMNAKLRELFTTTKGAFDRAAWEKLTPQDVRSLQSRLRQETLEQWVNRDLTTVPVPDLVTKTLLDTFRSQRSFNVVSFVNADYPDSEVVSWLGKNKDLFKSRNFSSLTVANKDVLVKLISQIKAKTATFEDLAKGQSIDSHKDAGGSRGKSYAYALRQELGGTGIADTVFALADKGLSDPIQVTAGWMVLRADDAAVDADGSSAGVIKDVRAYIENYATGAIDDWLQQYATEFTALARKDGWDKAVGARKLKVQETNLFPINLQTASSIGGSGAQGEQSLPVPQIKDGTNLTNLANAYDREAFYQAAFALAKNAVSDPILLQGQVVVLRLKEEKTYADGDKDFTTLAGTVEALPKSLVQADIRPYVVDTTKMVSNVEAATARAFQTP